MVVAAADAAAMFDQENPRVVITLIVAEDWHCRLNEIMLVASPPAPVGGDVSTVWLTGTT